VTAPDAITVSQLVGSPEVSLMRHVRTDDKLADDARRFSVSHQRDHRTAYLTDGVAAARMSKSAGG
jgi:hypothetical protein